MGLPGVNDTRVIPTHLEERDDDVAICHCRRNADKVCSRIQRGPRRRAARKRADVAQLVAHHLAKVRVASSSLVIRSSSTLGTRAISSAVEHYLDTVGVTGSIPVSRTEGSPSA